jgi:hypothetical protein
MKSRYKLEEDANWIRKYLNRTVSFEDVIEERKEIKKAYIKHIKPCLPKTSNK